MQINSNTRFVALDFETTGLDITRDEPIQIGIVVADSEFRILESYQSLIKPKKNIKELKAVVSHITGLTLGDLADSPYMEDILDEVKTLITPESILIGHNIAFDIGFLKKYRPEFSSAGSLDTFDRSQILLHYQPSYALEVLRERVHDHQGERLVFEDIHGSPIDQEREQYHDALYDSYVSLGLFRFLAHKLILLGDNYPVLNNILFKDEMMKNLFGIKEVDHPLKFPLLTKPYSGKKVVEVPSETLDLGSLASESSWYTGNLELREFFSRTSHNQPIIYSVHTRQKLDIIKHHLHSLGHEHLGFAKEEQVRDLSLLESLAGKETLADFEWQFFIKYFSHHHQGLRVIELKNKDYRVFQLTKQASTTKQHPIMITTHGGLYNLIKDTKYKEHTICFLDADWWYQTYNNFQSQKVDFGYFAQLLDQRYYVFRRRSTLTSFDQKESKKIHALLYSFKQSFTVFLGTLGIEITKKFTGIDASSLEIDPIIDNSDFFNTNKLREKIQTLAHACWSGRGEESLVVQQQRFRIEEVLESLVKVEKKMQDNKYLHYTFSVGHNYTEYSEFLDQFGGHKVVFCSNFKTSNPALIDGFSTRKKFTECRDHKQLINLLQSQTHKRVFVLSSAKHISQRLFDKLTTSKDFKEYTILAEKISGGTGKNIFRLQHSEQSIVIGGYYFLLAIFAKQEPLDIIIVHHASGPLKELILSDCLYYAPPSGLNKDKDEL